MKQPCVKDCPDRAPGCCCEKRRAWLREHHDRKKKVRAAAVVDSYEIDSHRASKKHGGGRQHNWRHE